MKDLWVIFDCEGDWEDYTEEIVWIGESHNDAKRMLEHLNTQSYVVKQSRKAIERKTKGWNIETFYNVWTDKILSHIMKYREPITYEEFLEHPEIYPDLLKLLSDKERNAINLIAFQEKAHNKLPPEYNSLDLRHYYVSSGGLVKQDYDLERVY